VPSILLDYSTGEVGSRPSRPGGRSLAPKTCFEHSTRDRLASLANESRSDRSCRLPRQSSKVLGFPGRHAVERGPFARSVPRPDSVRDGRLPRRRFLSSRPPPEGPSKACSTRSSSTWNGEVPTPFDINVRPRRAAICSRRETSSRRRRSFASSSHADLAPVSRRTGATSTEDRPTPGLG